MDEQVKRSDLKGYDRMAQDIILEAQAKGARVRLSNRTHAVLYFGDNSTAVPRKMKTRNRSSQNTIAAVRRLFR